MMQRIATETVHIEEENIIIHKGQSVKVDATLTSDPSVHENPEKFDIYRWLRMRETPEWAIKAQLVSTSPEHLAFGYGIHVCPGRFFAATEVKIALCHLLLNYDWELASGTTTELLSFGSSNIVNPLSTLRYRKRKTEIDLKSLSIE